LEVLTGLWSAQPFQHQGPHYPIKQAQFLPGPLQQPRIPIWVGGFWPAKRPLRRMARWDGMFPLTFSAANRQEELAQLKEMIEEVKAMRAGNPAPFDVVLLGTTPLGKPAESRAVAAEYAAIGATWYLESIAPLRDGDPHKAPWSFELLRERVLEGPPQQ
jgi:hypothetical protein